MIYPDAHKIAVRILKQLEPYCLKIDFAGDIAKEKDDVEVIKIFCLPRPTAKDVRYSPFVIEASKIGMCVDGELQYKWAKFYLLEDAIHVELFMPPANLYYYRLTTHEAQQSFIDKINSAREIKGLPVSCETEYDFFSHLGIEWKSVKDRV